MRFLDRALLASAMSLLTAGAPPAAYFHGLSSGNGSSFVSSPDGKVVSILFDDFKLERIGEKIAPKTPVERTFTLSATPAAASCRASFTLRGAALVSDVPRAGQILLIVDGRSVVLRPKVDA